MAFDPSHFLVVGAGAAGLMAARELARSGQQVTILEARNRCGGRIYPLPEEEFGYPAEGGAEFIHGTAPLTRALMREARLSLLPRAGSRWSARGGVFSQDEAPAPHAGPLHRALRELKTDLTVAEFLQTHFADQRYSELRRTVIGTVEGYDAADPRRASTFMLRDEWLGRGLGQPGRIAGGYGALIEHLAAECRRHGVSIRLGSDVSAIEEERRGIVARCRNGGTLDADGAILAVPLPLLREIELPPAAREKAALANRDIGFGNVAKIMLRFRTKWWADQGGRDLADLSFLFSGAAVPTWWTQYPAEYPVLTGWFAGPKADREAPLSENELVEMGLASLAESFKLPRDLMTGDLVASRAVNWANDPFARGAYSYATPQTRKAQAGLKQPAGGTVYFSGEALYACHDIGTVEAALASGVETAQKILAARP